MCVFCMFYGDWELGGRKKLSGRDFFELKLVRVGLQVVLGIVKNIMVE